MEEVSSNNPFLSKFLAFIIIFAAIAAVLFLVQTLSRIKAQEKTIAIVVLGDLGHSPRMQVYC